MQLNSFHEIEEHHRHIFLSAHFDDVVYSCGGTLAALANSRERPLVITVCSGMPASGCQLSPYAIEVQQRCESIARASSLLNPASQSACERHHEHYP